MPADCIVRAVPAGTVGDLMKEAQRFSGEFVHVQDPKGVAGVKGYFRDKRAVEPFTGFIIKVNRGVRDYDDTRAYKGRPVIAQKVYKVKVAAVIPGNSMTDFARDMFKCTLIKGNLRSVIPAAS